MLIKSDAAPILFKSILDSWQPEGICRGQHLLRSLLSDPFIRRRLLVPLFYIVMTL